MPLLYRVGVALLLVTTTGSMSLFNLFSAQSLPMTMFMSPDGQNPDFTQTSKPTRKSSTKTDRPCASLACHAINSLSLVLMIDVSRHKRGRHLDVIPITCYTLIRNSKVIAMRFSCPIVSLLRFHTVEAILCTTDRGQQMPKQGVL